MDDYRSLTDGQANIEIALLRAELRRLSEHTPAPSTPFLPTPPSIVLLREHLAIADGSGCASPEIYHDMVRTNWHGRLGRAHMADVDSMCPAKLEELDAFLHRTIAELFPNGTGMGGLRKDTVFATLKDLGIRLEDRTAFADATVFHDDHHLHASTVSRMRNFAAHFYGPKWERYWNGVVLETLVELARYRGLFTGDGMLRERVGR